MRAQMLLPPRSRRVIRWTTPAQHRCEPCVSPASLTVTAANANRPFGQANPVFTGTITGVTNGDNITATYSCGATTDSPAGNYPIMATLVDPNEPRDQLHGHTDFGTLTVGSAP